MQASHVDDDAIASQDIILADFGVLGELMRRYERVGRSQSERLIHDVVEVGLLRDKACAAVLLE